METLNKYKVDIFPPSRQGKGEFDNGKITEIKPIDFPQGTGEGKRIGPLFYWAWASAKGDGIIHMHPHQAFEIISYVLEGEIGHTDSLGNKTRVGAGGAQIMQTGSGVYHQEEMYGERTDFFQIWFEPNLRETIKNKPTYRQLTHEDFPNEKLENGTIKRILGKDSPVQLVADTEMFEIKVNANSKLQLDQKSNTLFAAVVVNGSGKISVDNESFDVQKKYYINIMTEDEETIEINNNSEDLLTLVCINVPLTVEYKLYGE